VESAERVHTIEIIKMMSNTAIQKEISSSSDPETQIDTNILHINGR